MPCGTSMMATVKPADKSDLRYDFLYFGSHSRMGMCRFQFIFFLLLKRKSTTLYKKSPPQVSLAA